MIQSGFLMATFHPRSTRQTSRMAAAKSMCRLWPGVTVASVAVVLLALCLLHSVPPVSAVVTRSVTRGNETVTHRTFVVAALSDKGFDYFNKTLAPTFDVYLNRVLSEKYDGLVSVVTYPTQFKDLIDDGLDDKYDFAFTNPALFTCVEAELGMSALLTLRRFDLGEELSQFGGVIFTRADRDDINTLHDVINKQVAAVSFITFGGFQSQWGKLRAAGVDFLVDTEQVKFTGDENLVVEEVMEGRSDIGFVTTGVLEAQVFNGTLDLKQVKILEAENVITTEGNVFPFITSTEVLSPEWALAALPTVDWQIQVDVMDALIALEPTSEFAIQGRYAAWQAPLSYTVTRALQVSLGVMFADGLGSFSCVRTKSIIEAVVCPFGFVKKSDEEVAMGCELAGIDCSEGYDCLCQPCKPACPANARLLSTGDCECEPGYVQLGTACAPVAVLVITILIPLTAFIVVIVLVAMRYQQKKVDTLWHIRPFELKFEDPVDVLGVGTYGVVVKAEYRGTSVAVKRVGPPDLHRRRTHASLATRDKQGVLSPAVLAGIRAAQGSSSNFKRKSPRSKRRSKTSSTVLGSIKTRERRAMEYIVEVFDEAADQAQGHQSTTRARTTKSGEQGGRTLFGRMLGKASTRATLIKMRDNFIKEMRTLSKLRHPCVTTVMGAVMIKGFEPMMVMEHMDLGSLYSILHNETMELDGETRYHVTIDVVSGCRFLHSSDPPLIHGDLKSLNVLVDSKFRAKVSDFGLSESGSGKACGTPYWMAPEVLRGEPTSVASDVYSFAIILFEIFSRKDPYPADTDLENTLKEVIKRKRRPLVPANCPDVIAQLMREAWHPDPDRRPSFDELARRFGHIDPSDCRVEEYSKKGKDSNKVLEDVFPPHIAKALREGKKIEPEHHDCVTIFFSDIVGFTTISSTLNPQDVMNMLDRLYTKLDALADEMELFKVETIGDAYMAVTNLLKEQKDHAARIGRFAVAAIKAANSTLIKEDEPDLGCVNIRVGFHSGPVVANVVGTKNPRYCLFGDTVNTASRMESNSEKNRIHMSEAAAELVLQQAPDMLLEPRKAMHIKGKGKMQTYFLIADDIDHASSSDTAALFETKRKASSGAHDAADDMAAADETVLREAEEESDEAADTMARNGDVDGTTETEAPATPKRGLERRVSISSILHVIGGNDKVSNDNPRSDARDTSQLDGKGACGPSRSFSRTTSDAGVADMAAQLRGSDGEDDDDDDDDGDGASVKLNSWMGKAAGKHPQRNGSDASSGGSSSSSAASTSNNGSTSGFGSDDIGQSKTDAQGHRMAWTVQDTSLNDADNSEVLI